MTEQEHSVLSVYRMKFRYLYDAAECWFNEEAVACVVCGQMLPGYGFIQIDEEGYEQHYVCESCLIAGRLAERDLRVNDGNMNSLLQQLRERFPEMQEAQQEALALARTAEVEHYTPRPSILNLFTWPVHCGDYCVYFRQIDADDLNRLAAEGDGKSFLASHLHTDYADVDEVFIENVWADKLRGFMRFYLWQCPQCAQYLLTYDSD